MFFICILFDFNKIYFIFLLIILIKIKYDVFISLLYILDKFKRGVIDLFFDNFGILIISSIIVNDCFMDIDI